MSVWQNLINAVPTLITQVGEVFKRKHEVKLRKIDSTARIEEAKANAYVSMLTNRQNADINWEQMSIQNSGWKDEYLTIFITSLVAACFIPWTQPYVGKGFFYLSHTPMWFQTSFLIVIGSAFGVRVFTGFSEVLDHRKVKKAKRDAEVQKLIKGEDVFIKGDGK